MKRLLPALLFLMVGLTACENESVGPLFEMEGPGPSFAKNAVLEFEPPEECPVSGCLLAPITLSRNAQAPTVWIGEFSGVEEKDVELVIYASNPRTTTVKAWLNEEMVLLPSELPRAGSTEVRVPLTVVEGDALEVRLSGKPGTQVAFWLEEVADQEEDPEDPAQGDPDPGTPDPGTPSTPSYTFYLTNGTYGITSNMNENCSSEFSGSRIADWTEVVDAVDKGMAREDIFNGFYAFVLNNGVGLVSDFFGSYHHIVSTVGGTGTLFGVIGTDFTLTSTTTEQQVLCVTTSS